MLRISTALLLSGAGFLQVMFSTASIQVQLGEWATMWCAHDIHVSGDLLWFKQTDDDVPIAIVRMLYTESLQKVEPRYFNDFTEDRFVMHLFSKNTSLTIKNTVDSDSGFYFCGTMGYFTKFGNGTRLEVKVTHAGKTPQIVNPAMVNDLCSSTIFNHSEKNVKEKSDIGTSQKDEKSPVSTEECSRDIYFTLTLLFGGIIFFTCIIPLILAIIKENKRLKHKKVAEHQTQQQDKENYLVEHAAVNFSNKRHKTAGRHTEDSTAVYTLALHET